MRALYAVASNTLAETLRLHIFGLLLCLTAILILFSPAFAMFTFLDSTKLVQDMGLASILLTGLFLSCFCASNVLSREIECGTALTVLSKPISRESFLLGKFIGLSAAILLAVYNLTLILILTFRFGTKDTASTKLDWMVMVGMVAAILLALLYGLIQNFFFGRPFLSCAVKGVTATLTLCFGVFCLYRFDKSDGDYHLASFGAGINWQIAIAAVLVFEAILILTAVAVTLSARLRIAATLGLCASVLFGGMLSEYLMGEVSQNSILFRLGYAFLPNMQLYWVTEGMVEGKVIPADYMLYTGGYTACYVLAVLAAGLLFFAGREVREI
ncbi:MAG: ABC transporter permease subunit [Planctomycetota bacterium]|jgi:hypothetical protein